MGTKTGPARRQAPRQVPREHGAWVMLCGSLLTGLLAAGRVDGLAALAVTVAVLAGFVGQEGFRRLPARGPDNWRFSVGALALAAIGLGWLVGVRGRVELVGPLLAAVGLAAVQVAIPRRWRMGPWAQLAAMGGLTLPAPLAFAAVRGSLGWPGWWLWAACWLCFGGSVFNVHMLLVAPRADEAGRAAAWRRNLLALVVQLGLAALLIRGGHGGSAWLLVVAYLPLVLRVVAGRRWLAVPPSLKLVGWTETAFTVWFMVWLVLWTRGN